MSEPFLGEIRMFGGNFAPRGWAFCKGQLLPVTQYTALFSILGTVYGGDGRTTFGVPDLQGRSPIGMGAGANLNNVNIGEKAGAETVTLLQSQMPVHVHGVSLQVAGTPTSPTNTPSNTNNVLGASPGSGPGSASIWSTAMNSPVNMAPVQTEAAGSSQPVDVRNPYIGINFIIALQGVFPSRN